MTGCRPGSTSPSSGRRVAENASQGTDHGAASCLLLQAEHPGSALYVATGDMNLQTKLAAIGLPFVELP